VNVSIGRRLLFSSSQQDHPTDDRWFQNFKYVWLAFVLSPEDIALEIVRISRDGVNAGPKTGERADK
jgi:hypothetical protein